MLKIYPLSEKKSLYPVLAYWSFQNWYLNRNVPFQLVMHEYKRRSMPDSLPCSFIAFWGEFPVGMVSVKETDMLRRQDLSPWLSALYVSPEYRNRGIGAGLISAVLDFCSYKGFRRVFLFIDSRHIKTLDKYYAAREWIFLDNELDSDGNMTKILFHEL